MIGEELSFNRGHQCCREEDDCCSGGGFSSCFVDVDERLVDDVVHVDPRNIGADASKIGILCGERTFNAQTAQYRH